MFTRGLLVKQLHQNYPTAEYRAGKWGQKPVFGVGGNHSG